jgi:hypothetical protein
VTCVQFLELFPWIDLYFSTLLHMLIRQVLPVAGFGAENGLKPAKSLFALADGFTPCFRVNLLGCPAVHDRYQDLLVV